VQTFLTEASGRAERDAAMLMMEAIAPGRHVTLGADKNYDTREFVRELRGMNITPHVAIAKPDGQSMTRTFDSAPPNR
jgi:hypothetical protein